MASASFSGYAEREHMDIGGDVNALRNQVAGPLHDYMQHIPHEGVSTTIDLEPRSRLQFLATWLLGYLRYTCDILTYLTPCLPSIQVDQRHEEASVTSYGMNLEPSVLIVDCSNVAESEHRVESKHKVFLSHSGDQKDFVEQLCIDLERCDRYPFFDKLRSSLPIGEKFPKLIFDAIEQCHVGVVVLSEEFFVRSKWPMLELNSMVKEFEKPNSRIRIIPVFYHLSINAFKDPKNQGRWTSKWEEWALNDKRISVTEWKRALRALGSINGLQMKEGYGDVKFREEIVSVVCGLVPPETRWDDSHVQGRLRTCKVILDKMEEVSINSRAPIVGLYGMGGMGKTTICKVLCNELASKFCDNVCHIELGSGSELELLQKALKTLTNLRHDLLDELKDTSEGYVYLKRELQNHSLFLALDNIQDEYKSMEIAQAYLKAIYGCGSFILVTARSLDVLKMLNLEEMNCLEMPKLEENEARSLLLHYIKVLPLENQVDEVHIKDCMKQCYFVKGDGKNRHYHPLALKVLGQQLGWDAKELTTSLKKIRTFNKLSNMEHPVFSILRNAFDTLMPTHQMLFMDLALFMGISDYNHINFRVNRWDWLGMVYDETTENMNDMLEVLKRKSLVENVSGDFSTIGIHDLWIEFAVLETKTQDFTNQRWVYQVDGKSATLGRRGRCKESVERMCFLNEGWKSLNGLNLDDFVNVEAFKMAVEIHMPDCVLDLDLSGLKHLKSLWVTTFGLTVRAGGLRSLTNLSFLLWNAPGFSPWLNEIRHFTNLQFLGLGCCEGVEVVDVTELKALRVLMIRKFPDLITVTGLSSRLANLQRLRIIDCGSLRECPGVGELYTLEELDLMGCYKLEKLPSLGRLTKLKSLGIRSPSIRAVPGLSDLVALEYLSADGCSKLAMLPDLGKLTKLQGLYIGPAVQGVLGLGGLISLKELYASFDKLLGEQPVFPTLSVLQAIDITRWNGSMWTSIRSLLMLESLRFIDCKGEDVVPDLKNLERLKSVVLFDCDVKDLSGLSNLTELEGLVIHGCTKLEKLPDFERLTKLWRLRIRGCDGLSGWPNASDLCSLQWLSLDGFSWIKMMPELDKLKNLRELELWGPGCEKALGMAPLSQLQRLNIEKFLTSEALDFSNFPQLKELWIKGCSALKRVTCNKPLTALDELKVFNCGSLVEMPDLSMFPQFEVLVVCACSSLKKLSCCELLAHIKKIELIGCDRVEKLDLSRFPKLKVFSQEGF